MAYDIEWFFVSDSSPWNWSNYIPVGISLLALWAVIWQGCLARRHNKLTVRPHLAGHSSYNNDMYYLSVRNDGLGPAIITASRVYKRGRLVEGGGTSVIEKAFEGVDGCVLEESQFFFTEFVLPAGESINICAVRFESYISDIEEYLSGLLFLEIDYKSAYEEKRPMYKTRQA